jgi:hypothetical protein
LLIIGRDTSVHLKALKDGLDLLDPDIRVFTRRQSDAMSKLIVFVTTLIPDEYRQSSNSSVSGSGSRF